MSGIYTRKNVGMNGLVENRTEDHINEEWFRDIIDVNLYDRIDGFEYEGRHVTIILGNKKDRICVYFIVSVIVVSSNPYRTGT